MLRSERGFLKSRAAWLLTAVLVGQAALLYGFSRGEQIPEHKALKLVPAALGSWSLLNEGTVEPEVLAVLRADDTLSRTYGSAAHGASAHLFVAYFGSQRAGQTPHSPKNCLPGSGWVPSSQGIITVDVPGRGPIELNRYVVSKGDARSLVFYWYQSRDRVVASEYSAKMYVFADAMRYNRTDTALVRVTVPVIGEDATQAQRIAEDFVRSFFAPLRAHFPA